MEQFEDIDSLERQISELVASDSRRWQRVAQLLLTVKQRRLYENRARSFTAYVKQLAAKFGLHESNFWRILSAGQFYLQIRNTEDLGSLEQAQGTPEKLELVGKISRYAPDKVREELTMQTLETGLEDMNLQQLRETWQAYRPQKSVKVKLSGKLEGLDLEEKEGMISHQEVIASLREAGNVESLLGKLQHFRLFTGVPVRLPDTRQADSLDAVLLAQKFEHRKRYLITAGFAVKTSLKELEKLEKVQAMARYCDEFYVAVPDQAELIAKARELVEGDVGILTIKRQVIGTGLTVHVIRASHRQKAEPGLAAELYGSLLPVAMGWKEASLDKKTIFST